jgi:hypothetical protein
MSAVADQIAVDPDHLRAHADRICEIRDDVLLAAEAAASTDMAGGAFGVMCSFMVPAALATTHAAHESIVSAADLLGRACERVRGWADDADETESAQCGEVSGLQSGVYIA